MNESRTVSHKICLVGDVIKIELAKEMSTLLMNYDVKLIKNNYFLIPWQQTHLLDAIRLQWAIILVHACIIFSNQIDSKSNCIQWIWLHLFNFDRLKKVITLDKTYSLNEAWIQMSYYWSNVGKSLNRPVNIWQATRFDSIKDTDSIAYIMGIQHANDWICNQVLERKNEFATLYLHLILFLFYELEISFLSWDIFTWLSIFIIPTEYHLAWKLILISG